MTRLPHPARAVCLALAAATTALGLALPAHAQGGVRLNFGGPLGTFVATPTPGYGGGTASTPRKAAPRIHTAKRTLPESAPSPRERVATHHVVSAKPVEKPAEKPAAVAAAEPAPIPPILVSRTLTESGLPHSEVVAATDAAETIVAADAATPAVESSEPAAKDGPATCRKFIPAVGVTVTVSCD